jgi:hypothetical protein
MRTSRVSIRFSLCEPDQYCTGTLGARVLARKAGKVTLKQDVAAALAHCVNSEVARIRPNRRHPPPKNGNGVSLAIDTMDKGVNEFIKRFESWQGGDEAEVAFDIEATGNLELDLDAESAALDAGLELGDDLAGDDASQLL